MILLSTINQAEYDIMGDSFMAVSIIGDSGFAEYGIMGDSFMAVSIIGDSGFAEYDIIGDSFIAVSIIGDSGFAEYDIIGDSFIAVSIIGDSGFAEYDIIGDSFIAVSIIGDSGFAEYDIKGDSFMAVSIIGDSGSVFLPLYTKFRYSKVSAPQSIGNRDTQNILSHVVKPRMHNTNYLLVRVVVRQVHPICLLHPVLDCSSFFRPVCPFCPVRSRTAW
jgi:hypothetical protein